MSPRLFVILVNLGTPEEPSAAAVRSFLAEFLTDPAVIDFPGWFWKPILNGIILKRRPGRVAELYREIWTAEGSPLEVDTRRLAERLDESLAEYSGAEVRWAYRYGQPSLARRLDEAREQEAAEIVVLPLYAHRTSSTTGTVVEHARALARSAGLDARHRVEILAPDDPGFVRANVERLRQALEEKSWEPEHLLMSFHGIPARYDRREGELYSRDCGRSYEAILEALEWSPERATLAYQSKFGPERWLTPTTSKVLEALPGEGVRRLAVMTPGFLTEGLETIEEIGMQGRAAFLSSGGTHFLRVPAVADHPAIVESLARLAVDRPDSP
jgi:ferrochelatase